MRPNPIVVKKGEAPRRMLCGATGKAVQSGATAFSLTDYAWCYINPGKELSEERLAELLILAAEFAPKTAIKKTEGDK
jgi:hypothetical protein